MYYETDSSERRSPSTLVDPGYTRLGFVFVALEASLEARWQAVAERHQALTALGRRAIEEAHAIGVELRKLNGDTPYGQWIPRLEAAGIARTTAWRYMQPLQHPRGSHRGPQKGRGGVPWPLCPLGFSPQPSFSR